MTYRERFEKIKTKELRNKLLAATPADVLENAVDGRSDSNLLRGAFIWGCTKEGYTYWDKLNDAVSSAGSFDAGWNKLPPPKTSTMVMERAGFKFPAVHARKDDPRGKEYGYFIVCMDTDKYTVTKFDYVNTIVWSATFSEDSFLAWARDYT
jgi:hypothetical protein